MVGDFFCICRTKLYVVVNAMDTFQCPTCKRIWRVREHGGANLVGYAPSSHIDPTAEAQVA